MTARYQVQKHVAIITIDNPPINSMGMPTRQAIAAAFNRASVDATIQAIVITGANGVFTGGADIREFGKPIAMQPPTLHDLIRLFEASTKPVISAINGVCMGGGTEISLGCHYRVAAPGVLIGLPEVKIGILPGAGGTQRLPRVAGLELALSMIVSGEPVTAEVLANTQTIDRLIDGDFISGVVAFAEEILASTAKLPLVRDSVIALPEASAIIAKARADVRAKYKYLPAPMKCVDAVEAAVRMDIDAGLQYEFALFTELVATVESAALRHGFFAERAASKISDMPDHVATRQIHRVAIVGAGTMGGGICMNFLNAGIPVTLLEMKQDALDGGVATITKNYHNSVNRGKLTPSKRDERLALLTPTLAYEQIKNADLVIEAVYEDIDVKEHVFKTLDSVMKPGAILASNTSTLDLNRIANATNRPGDVVGLHFFSPANVMKLLEIVRGEKTSFEVLATVMKLAKKIKKVAVVSAVCDGFIGNRMLHQYLRQAWFLLDEGASVVEIDSAIEEFGFAMGPFRMSDLAGNDIGWQIRKRRYAETPEVAYSRLADRLCERGRFGQKTGAGWYDYRKDDRVAHPSSVVEEMLHAYRRTLAIEPRKISAEEICQRLVYALVNEGARILEDGIAQRASDIDVIYQTGYGFPAWRGGPMFYAETVGLAKVVDSINQFALNAHADPTFWVPAENLLAAARAGRCLEAA